MKDIKGAYMKDRFFNWVDTYWPVVLGILGGMFIILLIVVWG